MPPWAKENTQVLNGKVYTVVCSGEGPSADIARGEALNSCRSLAARQLHSDLKVKVLSLETEKDIAFHQEISSEGQYSGLLCNPQNESIEEENGHITAWLK